MAEFRDLDEFLVVEPYRLPIRGKLYEFPGEISARAWLLLQTVAEKMQAAQRAEAAGQPVSDDEVVVGDEEEVELRSELFGDAEQEMIDDGLTSAHLKAVMYTLVAWHLNGEEAAIAIWNAQGKAPAPNRAERRKKTPTRSQGSRGGSTAQETPADRSGETS